MLGKLDKIDGSTMLYLTYETIDVHDCRQYNNNVKDRKKQASYLTVDMQDIVGQAFAKK